MADKKIHGTQHYREIRKGENGEDLFQCRKCLEWNPREGFEKLYNPKSACGVLSECKACRKVYMRNYMRERARKKRAAEKAAREASEQIAKRLQNPGEPESPAA